MKIRRPVVTGIAGLLLIVLCFLVSCSREKPGKAGKELPVPVEVGLASRKTIPVQLEAIGNVQAYSTVSVRSLVGGELKEVHFSEGQDVKKGDLLFTIDPRPFEVALEQAEAALARDRAQVKQAEANLARDYAVLKQAGANLERDKAQAKNAQVEAGRYKDLLEKNLISREQYDQSRTSSEALQATLRADKAAMENAEAAIRASKAAVENAQSSVRATSASVENARIQLGYTPIRSPVDGRTGSFIAQPGNIIKANDTTPLVVIVQIQPIQVSFSVPEQTLIEVKKHKARGELKVEATIPNDRGGRERGVITFIDNTVDSNTGTIRLKGTFANPSRRLWPGQFVNVLLTLTSQPNVVVVPSQAVQIGQQGQYVFVVKPNLTVESVPVTVSRTVGEESVIEKGLKGNEKIVTDGQMRLRQGSRVDVKNGETKGTSKVKTR